ncbi:hypothetical protein Pelo_12688 [Pelomyxa schiedti]|nr:hypothetical protein Pelo_12688 [Pelomyxa schiedti]
MAKIPWLRLVLVGVALGALTGGDIDRCNVVPKNTLPEPDPRAVASLWWDLAVMAYPCVSLLWDTYKRRPPNWNKLAIPVFVACWYSVFYLLCAVLRECIVDNLCGRPGRSNSISGHFVLYIFHVLAMWDIPRLWHWKFSSACSDSEQSCCVECMRVTPMFLYYNAFVWYSFMSFVVLEATWLYGYHTVRQIAYGTILGVIGEYLCMVVLKKLRFPHHEYSRRVAIILGCIAVMTSLLLVGPFRTFLPATGWEITRFLVCYAIVLSLALKVSNPKKGYERVPS